MSLLRTVQQVKIIIITNRRLFQILEDKTKNFHKIKKFSLKECQEKDSEYLNEQ